MSVFQDNKWEVPIKTRYGDIPWSVIVDCSDSEYRIIQQEEIERVVNG
jgi:hypothetical protein